MSPTAPIRSRLLIVDDNPAIHEDMGKVFASQDRAAGALEGLESALFGAQEPKAQSMTFDVDSAYQGQEALERVSRATAEGHPYSVAFVDMRMPPGWDGLETIKHLWEVDPLLQVVICTAYADYSWADITSQLDPSDNLLILKKPFDNIELHQMATALARKWSLHQQARLDHEALEGLVRQRTAELQSANVELRHRMEALQRVEMQLRLAQRLESVGRLAAGIAHEINTPLQFVSDSVQFLSGSLSDLQLFVDRCVQIKPAMPDGGAELARLEEELDVPYLKEEMPRALTRADEDLKRVAAIVRSMKELAHPGGSERIAFDVNQALTHVVALAKSEYAAVGDVVTEFGDLPPIEAYAGELNQTFLNLIINAGHAVADRVAGTSERGKITLRTSVERDAVVVRVSDTGCGIAPAHREKIFDPFFTTKEVGRGTGQGLAIALSAVMHHGGSIDFESQVGEGSTFCVRLPLTPAVSPEAAILETA
jgi:two-component system NtrC family sensor kinase